MRRLPQFLGAGAAAYFMVLLVWIEIEITLCNSLLTFSFIEFFANGTTLIFASIL